jgi:deoxyribodipyrimidine photo-lyase
VELLDFEHGVPAGRLRRVNAAGLNAAGEYVVYWMTAARRLSDNFALQYAAGEAGRLGRPLLILEAVRADYEWASDRFHRFVFDGMAEHAAALEATPVRYYPYVEPAAGEGRGLIEALGAAACCVVTDEYPCFFLPRMIEAAGRRLNVRLTAVDSNGLLPLAATDRAFVSAYQFRRELQKQLPDHLGAVPAAQPLRGKRLSGPARLSRTVLERWPAMTPAVLADPATLARLPIDHGVPPVPYHGGERPARAALRAFLDKRLADYAEQRNDADAGAVSGLSPWLHWGHLSVHRVFRDLSRREEWSLTRLGTRVNGSRTGWWGMSPAAEAFLDEIVTWRELGFNMTSHRSDYDRYESLPEWARATLVDHEADPRPALYTLDQLENAQTSDQLWNAAQRQLRREGRIHNYLRMLWGKKVIEWTRSAPEALHDLIELNNRWAVDGRDPNSYSGIFWCFGRYDRPWPERRVFGKVRCMTSESTQRKTRVAEYLERYG